MQLRTAFLTADDSGDGELSLKEVRKEKLIKFQQQKNSGLRLILLIFAFAALFIVYLSVWQSVG